MSQMNVQIVNRMDCFDHHAAFVSVKTIDGELGFYLIISIPLRFWL